MTAHAMKGDRERCLEAGMDAYVSKPLQAQELFAVIESVAPTSTVAETDAAGHAPFSTRTSFPGPGIGSGLMSHSRARTDAMASAGSSELR